MIKKIFFSGVIFTVAYSCSDTSNEGDISEMTADKKLEIAEGFELYESNCVSCHSSDASMENRLAPPMIAVKKHYWKEGMTLEAFTEDIMAFLNNPSNENSIMPGAVSRFNLMPKMNFTEDQISKIASYIFYTEIEKPDWFDAHYMEEHGGKIASTDDTPSDFGQKIALQTKSILGKNLIQAINSKGTSGAVSFCSTRAIPLTDSMAIASNTSIKRVSDKNRNPNNKANKAELSYIESAKLAIKKGESPKFQRTTVKGKQVGYYPIMTNKMCMQCHGQENTEILPETLTKINKLYSNDQATGYKTDELRGIWVVEWNEK
jgi:mono/diheme cytochrome c family protein